MSLDTRRHADVETCRYSSECTSKHCFYIHPCGHIRIYSDSQAQGKLPFWADRRGEQKQGPYSVDAKKKRILLPDLSPDQIIKLVEAECVIDNGGLTNVGYKIYCENRDVVIGTMVAGNSGRPGGACGNFDGYAQNLHANHTTQEEDVVSNWLLTESSYRSRKHEKWEAVIKRVSNFLYYKTIYQEWGFKKDTFDNMTIQNIDYRDGCLPRQYGDAWIVPNALLSCKLILTPPERNEYLHDSFYPTHLVFIAGPNCGAHGRTPSSTTRRTFNNRIREYPDFEQGVEAALFAGLFAMAEKGCKVALLAKVSCGIYAPAKFLKRINDHYMEIVNRVLLQQVLTENGTSTFLGSHFERVIVTLLK